MKIVGVDNFDREGPGHDDQLICTDVNEFYGKIIVDELNGRLCSSDYSQVYFRLVPDDYKLKEFKP